MDSEGTCLWLRPRTILLPVSLRTGRGPHLRAKQYTLQLQQLDVDPPALGTGYLPPLPLSDPVLDKATGTPSPFLAREDDI